MEEELAKLEGFRHEMENEVWINGDFNWTSILLAESLFDQGKTGHFHMVKTRV